MYNAPQRQQKDEMTPRPPTSGRIGSSFLIPTQLDALDNATIVLAPILLKQFGRLDIRRRIGIRIRQKRLNRGEDCGNVIDWRPLVLQNIEADAAVAIHVWVEALGDELHLRRRELEKQSNVRRMRDAAHMSTKGLKSMSHLGRLIRVVFGEAHLELKRRALPRRIVGSKDDCVPLHDVVVVRRTDAEW